MIQYDWYPNNKGKFRDRHAQGKCNVKMKAETGASTNQGTPKVDNKSPEVRREAGDIFFFITSEVINLLY